MEFSLKNLFILFGLFCVSTTFIPTGYGDGDVEDCAAEVAEKLEAAEFRTDYLSNLQNSGKVLFPDKTSIDFKRVQFSQHFEEIFPKEYVAEFDPRDFKASIEVLRAKCEKAVKSHPHVSIDDCMILVIYTGNFYAIANPLLRNGTPKKRLQFKNTLLALATARNNAPKFKGLTYRFSNFGSIAEIKKYFSETQNHVLDTFWSSSLNQLILNQPITQNDDTMFVIDGFSGAYVKYYSHYPEEEEVLFAPGTRFQVLKIEEVNRGKIKYIVRLKELPDP